MNVAQSLESAVAALRAAGCESPRLDAELLFADALGLDRGALIAAPETAIAPAHARVIGERVRRRVQREPVAYILGRKGFRYLELAVDARVLIPRPETELLVELALELPRGARVHDLGTGSGAVALALRQERPDLEVSASDASMAAVALARSNAARLGLELEVEHRRGMPAGSFELVLANLPYVREDEWPQLAPEISRYEPREALVGGEDGLDPIRELVDGSVAGAKLALEHAPSQAAAVRDLLVSARTLRDLAGHERVSVGEVP